MKQEPHFPDIWRPFTIQQGAAPPLKVRSGDGLWLELEDGARIMDLISSWWVNLHGHAHPAIADAIAHQARTLEHVIFAGFTHDPGEKLARRLLELSDQAFQHVFYSDNGSTAVEVSLKMALQYWKNRGDVRRNRFIAFEGAYHGDTVGAMSAGARSVFNDPFDHLLIHFDRVDFPETWLGDETVESREQSVLDEIGRLLESAPGEFAGIIIEPLVQGAGGMRMCRGEFLQKLEKLVRAEAVLIIYDEVMTGFGRTGSLFAWQRAGTRPDLVALSKGITGGFLPLAVTLATSDIYNAFWSDDPGKALWHGHSYTGNPLGCAAALASLDLLDVQPPPYADLERWHLDQVSRLDGYKNLEKPRVTGTIAAFDVKPEGPGGYLDKSAQFIRERFLKEGMLVRPLGNTVYFMPPYCIREDELAKVYEAAARICALQDK